MNISELGSLLGTRSEPSPWLQISQQRINQFADATDDHQFIHVDPERAARTPFGGTIAHGYLTLSLLPHLTAHSLASIEGLGMAINYGSDKVRFLQPVRAGSRIRAHQEYLEITERRRGQFLVRCEVSVEIEGEGKPALIAETLALFIAADPRQE